MDLIEGMLKKQTVLNSKGGEYYNSTYNDNLDLFSGVNRYTDTDKMIKIFKNAFNEDKNLATANLLYFLDIRNGKGERKVFKTLFKELCSLDKEYAIIVLNNISKLGRYDYILEALETPLKENVLNLIHEQLKEDMISENPSLLAKWLPSIKRHGKRDMKAVQLVKELEFRSEANYRKFLRILRDKIKIVEHNLSNKDYDIDFEKVPTKAMLKYRKAFSNHCKDKYSDYLQKADKGEAKVNTKGLYCYDIINKIYCRSHFTEEERHLYNAMWEQQKDILAGNNSNILVMADTSGSMTWEKNAIETSIGLAIYMAERNHGIFKDYYMTFSSRPLLQKVKGVDIVDKVQNVECIVDNTDIDKAFKLLLETCVENALSQEDIPSHIIIISDMEFDRGVYSEQGTNFEGWKKAFKDAGYKLPQIVFWNLGVRGFPVTKFDEDVCIINGFSTSIFENLLDLEHFTPVGVMMSTLKKYIEIIEKSKEN
jgi:uncharacterized protein with von Willebrand factor type A (vWA) domain